MKLLRLDSETYTVNVKSVGGAITADFERLLDGAEHLQNLNGCYY